MIRRLARHTLAIFWPGCICQEQWTAYKWRKLMPQLETFSGGSGAGGEPLQSWKDLWQEHASVKIWSPQIPCHMLSLWTWTKWIEISTHRLIDQEESTSRRPQPVFFAARHKAGCVENSDQQSLKFVKNSSSTLAPSGDSLMKLGTGMRGFSVEDWPSYVQPDTTGWYKTT